MQFCIDCVHRKMIGVCEEYPDRVIDGDEGHDCEKFERGDGYDEHWFRNNPEWSDTTEHRSENPYEWGRMCAAQDACENAPFGSTGGMDKRTDMKAPNYVAKGQRDEWLKGYRDFCDTSYGLGWETAEWGWSAVVEIHPDNVTKVPDKDGKMVEVGEKGDSHDS